jgi:hypothetical protein
MPAAPMSHRLVDSFHQDRIVIFGGSSRTLEFLRLATIRSDNVLLIAAVVDAPVRHYVNRFAIEYRAEANDVDMASASAALVTVGDPEAENATVRHIRRFGVPAHVADRPLLSDFSMLEFLERRASTLKREGA